MKMITNLKIRMINMNLRNNKVNLFNQITIKKKYLIHNIFIYIDDGRNFRLRNRILTLMVVIWWYAYIFDMFLCFYHVSYLYIVSKF